MDNINWGPIGKEVYQDRYARVKPDGSSETWPETVSRVIEGNVGFVGEENVDPKEIEKLTQLMLDFDIVPAGRHLWACGVAGEAISNCHVAGWGWHDGEIGSKLFPKIGTAAGIVNHIDFVFNGLMLGGGIGANYSTRYISRFPTIKKSTEDLSIHCVCDPTHPDYDSMESIGLLSNEYSHEWVKSSTDSSTRIFRVPDSREGWVKAARILLTEFFDEDSPTSNLIFDVSIVREEGAPIKGFGGTASGPTPLLIALRNIASILFKNYSKKLSSLDLMEMDHALASCVVAGGVRRSARMSIKNWRDKDIFEFIRCKQDTTKHWTTNISVEIDNKFISAVKNDSLKDHEHARRVFREVVKGMLTNGEPGFWNYDLSQLGEVDEIVSTNPCQPGWATVLTPDGITKLDNVDVGDTIWSNGRWTSIIKKVSSGNKDVYAYRTKAGTFYGTKNHKIMQNGQKVKVDDAETIDIMACPEQTFGAENPVDIMDGLVMGDGTVDHHYDDGGRVGLIVGDGDQCYFDDNQPISDLFIKKYPDSKRWYVSTTIKASELPYTHERSIPDRFKFGSPDKVRAFLKGLYSANGSVIEKYGRISLKASSFDIIEDVQQMLSSLGISSYYTINKPTETEFRNGTYVSKESYDLQIGPDRHRFRNLIGFIHPRKQDALRRMCENISNSGRRKTSYEIISKELVAEDEPVYDITVDDPSHTYWTAGLLVSNCGEIPLEPWGCCNLGAVNLADFHNDFEGACEAFRLLTRFLIRATCATSFDTKQNKIINRSRRIGLGLMGFQEWVVKQGVRYSECHYDTSIRSKLKKFKKVVREEARNYAFQLRIPEPVKVTTVAPTGTTAKLPGVSEGIHPIYARYFIRRVRYSSNNKEVVEKLKNSGFKVSEDLYSRNTLCVEYPCKDSLQQKAESLGYGHLVEDASEVSLEDHLAVQAMVQIEFVDNAISFTINLSPDAYGESVINKQYNEATAENIEVVECKPTKKGIDEACSTIIKYLPYLKGTTIMVDGTREQAPFERLSAEEFQKYADDGNVKLANAKNECAGGGCPIK